MTDGKGSARTTSSGPTPVTLHDVLVAWQNGRLTARQAMARSGIDTIAGLYGAARSSAVPVRKTLLVREKAAADAATAAIRGRLSVRATAGVGR